MEFNSDILRIFDQNFRGCAKVSTCQSDNMVKQFPKGLKIAIIRSNSRPISLDSYNCQEVGLATALTEYGVSTDIYMAGRRRNQAVATIISDRDGLLVRVINLPYIRLLGQNGFFPSLIKILRMNSYDLIQIQEDCQITSVIVSLYALKRKIPVVLCQGVYESYRGFFKRSLQFLYDYTFGKLLIKTVTASIAKTTEAKKYLMRKGFPNVTVCPIGLDPKAFENAEDINWREKLNIPQKGKVLLYVGIIESRRNVDFIIKLLPVLGNDIPQMHLIIVGDGPQKRVCEALAEKLGVLNKTKFIGRVHQYQLPSIYKEADLLLLPSSYEIYGMVVLEAMYFGVPVISSATAGPKEIIQDFLDGVVLDKIQIELWQKAMLDLFSDLSKKNDMGNKAKRKIRTQFLWSHLCKNYLEFYKKLLEK